MAHESNHIATDSPIETTKVSAYSSFWLIIILVGLFIGALNFIPAMSEKEEGKGEKKEGTEQVKEKEAKPEAEKKEAPEAPKPAENKEAEHK